MPYFPISKMTMLLIRLRGRTGWSLPLLFTCNKVRFSRDEAQCGQIRELPKYTWFESYTSRWVSDVTSCLDVGYIICLLAHDRRCNLTFTRPTIIANAELYATVVLPSLRYMMFKVPVILSCNRQVQLTFW